ncbi:hypothetical protein PAAG_03630 [Paracoccidioides lutzii Pb01]|uniref:Uncharacterized protein n=1 Tax=Paracoccidioides lutzii (strain ATCC MYA-826 / Pb01) TaxID=502779 RepID=C1GXQ6_PARBA|nr:hypothetical protein PAAG_03630 [Paracoccidioides lutzii Pb01]EEH41345.2 hypothetical protein PAAG_03630 [Paracoccidioides lutzii Pb01]
MAGDCHSYLEEVLWVGGSKIRPRVLHNKRRNGVSLDWQIQLATVEARHHFSATLSEWDKVLRAATCGFTEEWL